MGNRHGNGTTAGPGGAAECGAAGGVYGRRGRLQFGPAAGRLSAPESLQAHRMR